MYIRIAWNLRKLKVVLFYTGKIKYAGQFKNIIIKTRISLLVIINNNNITEACKLMYMHIFSFTRYLHLKI